MQQPSMSLLHGVVEWSGVSESLDDDLCTHISLCVLSKDCDVASSLKHITFIRSTILISVNLIGEESPAVRAQVACAITNFFRKNKHYRCASVFLLNGDQFERVIPECVEGGGQDPKACIPPHILTLDR